MLHNSDTFAILDGVGQGEGQGDPQGVSHWIGDDRTATDGSVSLVPQYSDSEDEDIVLVSESPTDCKWFQILISILGFGFYTWASGHGVGLPLLLYTCVGNHQLWPDFCEAEPLNIFCPAHFDSFAMNALIVIMSIFVCVNLTPYAFRSNTAVSESR